MNIQNQVNFITVPGIASLWYALQSEITLPFSVENKVIIGNDLVSAGPLNFIKPLYNSLQFGSAPDKSANGSAFTQVVQGLFLNTDKTIVDALTSLENKRVFLLFKDHSGQFRFMTSALISIDTATETILGQSSTRFSFSRKTSQQHYFYTGAATVNADGTLSFA